MRLVVATMLMSAAASSALLFSSDFMYWGTAKAARMPMIRMTTTSSSSVKPLRLRSRRMCLVKTASSLVGADVRQLEDRQEHGQNDHADEAADADHEDR